MSELRIFVPSETADLRRDVIPFIGQIVVVDRWFPVLDDQHRPTDKLVGYVQNFGFDVPEEEL